MEASRVAILAALSLACGGRSGLDDYEFDASVDSGHADAPADHVADAPSQPDALVCPDAHAAPLAIAMGLTGGARQIAAGGDYVYVPAADRGQILKISRCGGAPIVLVDKVNAPISLTLAAQRVFFSHDAGIGSVGQNGTGFYEVITNPTGLITPARLVTDASYVYFANLVGLSPLYRAALSGSSSAFVVDMTGEAAVDGTWIYGRQVFGGGVVISKSPLPGGTLIQGLTVPIPKGGNSIALDANYVYFDSPQGVARVNKTGGPISTLAKTGVATDMVVDGTSLVFATSKSIVRASVDGTSSMTLAMPTSPPTAVAVDAKSTYWLQADGALMRLDKP